MGGRVGIRYHQLYSTVQKGKAREEKSRRWVKRTRMRMKIISFLGSIPDVVDRDEPHSLRANFAEALTTDSLEGKLWPLVSDKGYECWKY